jgi:hypothetical protein
MDDAFIAGAVERDYGACVASPSAEIVLRAPKVAQPFLTRRGDKLDRMACAQTNAVDLGGQGEHDSEAAAVVVDSRTDEPLAIATYGEVGAARENRVEMGTDDDGRQVLGAGTAADDIARVVGVNFAQAAVAKAASDPSGTLLFFAGWRGDLGDRDLCTHDGVIMRRESGARGGEGSKGRSRVGVRRRARSHAYHCHQPGFERKWLR